MNLTLRHLCADDLAAVDQLRADLGWNQTILDWERLLAFSPEGCFVAEQNGGIVGTCTTVSYGNALAWIGMMMVHPAIRGQGIGKALLRRCVDHLRGGGVRCIKLDATRWGGPSTRGSVLFRNGPSLAGNIADRPASFNRYQTTFTRRAKRNGRPFSLWILRHSESLAAPCYGPWQPPVHGCWFAKAEAP